MKTHARNSIRRKELETLRFHETKHLYKVFKQSEIALNTMNVFEEVSRKFVPDFQRFTWLQAFIKISRGFNISFEFCKNLKDNLLAFRFRGSGLRLLGIRAFVVSYKLSEKFLQDSMEISNCENDLH